MRFFGYGRMEAGAMAVYFLRCRHLSRGKGVRVTQAAACGAGERIRDERTSEVYDYSDRRDVAHKEVVIPADLAGREDMSSTQVRETLWNAAEHAGRRSDLEINGRRPYEHGLTRCGRPKYLMTRERWAHRTNLAREAPSPAQSAGIAHAPWAAVPGDDTADSERRNLDRALER